jgi:hypothetical protein
VLAEYYGPNSTLPSSNCFCDEAYWASFSALSGEEVVLAAGCQTRSGAGPPDYPAFTH